MPERPDTSDTAKRLHEAKACAAAGNLERALDIASDMIPRKGLIDEELRQEFLTLFKLLMQGREHPTNEKWQKSASYGRTKRKIRQNGRPRGTDIPGRSREQEQQAFMLAMQGKRRQRLLREERIPLQPLPANIPHIIQTYALTDIESDGVVICVGDLGKDVIRQLQSAEKALRALAVQAPQSEVEVIVRNYFQETKELPGGVTAGSVLCTLLFAHDYLTKERLDAILGA